MNLTDVIKCTTLVVCCFGFLVSKAQTDTLYVLYENSEFTSKGGSGRIIDIDSTANYPMDKGRTYQYSIRNGVFTETVSFVYMNKYPSWSDRSIDVIEMETSRINELALKDNQWFANMEYYEVIRFFKNRNAVIFMGDKERIIDDKIYFIKVYFNYSLDE